MSRREKHRLMVEALEAVTRLRRIWGSFVGLPLVVRFYADNGPWTTVPELAERLDLSDDTIRRKLDELAAIGRVRVRRRGRTAHYRASSAWAEKSLQAVKSLKMAAKCG